MSTDDRTPSQDEARTVATDADHDPSTAAADHVPGPRDDVGAEPAAASPPPWRRVPDTHDDRDGGTVADSLLSEAPTAFMTAPGPSAATGATTAVRDPELRENGTGPADPPRASVRNRPPRQALLQLKRLDPWSVLKMALALAVVLWLVWMVAAGVLYGVLGGMGVWDRLNGTYADLVTSQQETGGSLISVGRVFGLAAVVGAVNSLLFAVAITVVAFVYNVAADLVGGIEVTLSERD
ncbi:DUF3566 domain-containing protein [Pseudonocardia sp. HH130629-09]|uniref:DUF3566 domain-containing protein n=1 Tax=Pseudonocardia sp. HH130629-09 TaxID=1641402 RepID=UPI0007615FC4|nr:DUF3566 domain-containing protein [Pseudonocardia sp. HH130629-09]